jgi:hypothetical protein
MHFLASVASGVTLAAAGFFGFFGGHQGPPIATSTPVHPVVNMTCIGAAVAARETSIDADVSTYTGSVTSAYTTRASSLAAAYALTTGNDAIRNAVKAAWMAFQNSMQTARMAWRKSQMVAWSTFATAVRACGGSAGTISDGTNASVDSSLTSS